MPRQARGAVRSALVAAGLELARSGGPDAVVLREVTRRVGVVPNAAYRHFPDREALLAAVRDEALGELARRMAERMGRVGPRQRLRAVGEAYLEFARSQPGLFDCAFATAGHPPSTRPFEHLRSALADLGRAGRPELEYPIWAAVHGLAVLLRGPLRTLTDDERERREQELLAFIGAAVSD